MLSMDRIFVRDRVQKTVIEFRTYRLSSSRRQSSIGRGVFPHGLHRLPQLFLKEMATPMQLTEQATAFLAHSALPYLKNFPTQGMHCFVLS